MDSGGRAPHASANGIADAERGGLGQDGRGGAGGLLGTLDEAPRSAKKAKKDERGGARSQSASYHRFECPKGPTPLRLMPPAGLAAASTAAGIAGRALYSETSLASAHLK